MTSAALPPGEASGPTGHPGQIPFPEDQRLVCVLAEGGPSYRPQTPSGQAIGLLLAVPHSVSVPGQATDGGVASRVNPLGSLGNPSR